MAPNKKYLSLEEAAEQLGLKPDELVRLREKGEVRGFADRGTWKFKSDDIDEFERSRQPDSDPDIPILSEFDDDDAPDRHENVIRQRSDMNSDSDVRLSLSDDPKKKRLSGSSAEVSAIDFQKSDSDIRLIEDPRDVKSHSSKLGSDSDVKIVKPKTEIQSDSDSDVKMINKSASKKGDSDSDVELMDSHLLAPLPDSDSDVRMADSDSDVRMAPLANSDSDVKLIGQVEPESDSDSDVKLIPQKKRKSSTDDLPIMSGELDRGATDSDQPLLSPYDSGIRLGGDSGARAKQGSGVKRDSGIAMAKDSGIRLGGDSGIRLQDDSGVQLIRPADSGISLEGADSAVRFPDSGISLGGDSGIALQADSGIRLGGDSGIRLGADSGIQLGADSGIKLGGSSGRNVKGGSGGKKRKSDSGRSLKGSQDSDFDDIEATSPMLLNEMDDSDELSGEISGEMSVGDTSELQALSDSGQNVVLFDEDEEAAPKSSKKPPNKSSAASSLDVEESFDEIEVADDDLSDESEFGDLDFDARDEGLTDSFSEGSNQLDFVAPKKFEAAKEVQWSAGFCGLLFLSMCALIVGSIVSADLLRIVWAGNGDSPVDPGMAWLLAGLWK